MNSSPNDQLIFLEEGPAPLPAEAAQGRLPWCILLVDDDEEVHKSSALALWGIEFEGRPLELVSALSAAQGRAVFETRDDIALAIVDVVMETPQAGLELVRYVRQELRNHQTRVVMRTGQAAMEIEDDIVRGYEIDDYKDKTELTSQKMRTMLYGRLRSYRTLCTIREQAQKELAQRSAEVAVLSAKLSFAQQHLIQSEKMASIGQLAAGVAHEINNPIGYIFSNFGTLEKYLAQLFELLDEYQLTETSHGDSQVLANLLALKEEVEFEFLKEDIPALMAESKEGILRVRKIVQDLKDFSHAGAAQDWQFADLNKGIASTLNVVNSEVKYKADVVTEFGQLPEVQCVGSQINQVVLNLVINAAQAMGPERGKITLRTGCDAACAWLEVEDTGGGIPAAVLPRIFDPFFTTKPVGQGTGLGLSLSYGIIQQHKGQIEVKSELGKGTTFKITIPLVQPELEP